MSESLPGIDPLRLTDWLAAQLPDFPPPYAWQLVGAGGSNLTYIVTAGNRRTFVLRRPPVRARLASAHDMQRETRLLRALAGSAVPVPEVLASCEDSELIGAGFYCMQHVEGRILRDQASCRELDAPWCARATRSLVEVQVALHQLDVDALGLGDLARRDAYLERQLKRWHGQVEAGRTRDLPLLDRLHAELLSSVPEQLAPPGLVHGDYRFDNVVLDAAGQVIAVLDWELCTIGDPVADFVWSLAYWAQPGEVLSWLQSPPTRHPAFPDREQVLALYRERSGYPLQNLQWYQVFSWWKQACIVEGVYSRLQQGARGGMAVESLEQIAARVEAYLETADALWRQLA